MDVFSVSARNLSLSISHVPVLFLAELAAELVACPFAPPIRTYRDEAHI